MKNMIRKICNCEREGMVSGLAYGVLWAMVILVGSWLSRGSEHGDSVSMMLISLSTIGFLVTDRRRKTK